MANYIFKEFESLGLNPSEPKSEEFMCIIKTTIENELVIFYMGKNDEPSESPLWQIWPEQKNSLFRKVFGKVNDLSEQKAKGFIERIVNNINGVSGVEWGI